MANSLISMIKGNSTLIDNTEVLDGQVLFNTDEKSILLDNNNTRTKYCGADKSNKNLAPIENGNTATRGYSAGSYVVWKEQLYKVLTQINSGTAFMVGTNIALDTVGAELAQINSDLATKQAKTDSSLNTTSKTIVGALNETYGKIMRINSVNVTWTDAWAYGVKLFRIDRIVSFSGEYQAGTQIASGTKIGTIQDDTFAPLTTNVAIPVIVYNSSHVIQNIKACLHIMGGSVDIYYYGDSPLPFQNYIGWSCSWVAVDISH